MKKKRAAIVMLVIAMVAVLIAWIEKPVWSQVLARTVTTSLNEHINGTVAFSSLSVSLDGRVTLADPVVTDHKGRTVITGQAIDVSLDWWHILQAGVNGGNPVGAISAVDIQKPAVYLQENSQKQWNVVDLVKSDSSSSDAGFRGTVRLHDGDIQALLADGTDISADSVNGALDFSNYPAVGGDVSTKVDGKALSVSGTYSSGRQYNAVLKGDSVRAVYLADFIPSDVKAVVQAGTIDNVYARISQTHNGTTLSGQADVNGGKGNVAGYAIDELQGHVVLTSDAVTLEHVSGTVNQQAFQASGTIKINTGSPVFDINVAASDVDVAALAQGLTLPFSGNIGTRCHVWGTTDDWSAAGTVTMPDIMAQGVAVHNASVSFTYDQGVADISSLSADVAGGHVEGTGRYNQNSGDFSAAVKTDAISLEQIPQIPVSILGTVSGQADVQGNVNDLSKIHAVGNMAATGISYNGIDAESAQIDFSYDKGMLFVHQASAVIGGGTVLASGTYGGAATDLSVVLQDIPLGLASSYAGVPLTGLVSATGRVFGSNPDWDGEFTATAGTVQGAPFDTIHGIIQGRGSRIQIPTVLWQYKDGSHRGSGYADLDSRRIHLSVQTSHMRLERLLPLVGKDNLPLTGWVDNQIDVDGPLDQLSATGSVQLTNGSAYGYLYKSASVRYRLDKGTVYLADGDIAAYQSHIRFYGTVGDTLAVHVESPDLDIAKALPQTRFPRKGHIVLNAYIGGTLSDPTAVGSIAADSLELNHMPVTGLKGDFGYYGGIARITDFSFHQGGGTYQASGYWNTSSGWIKAQASVSNGNIASWIQLLNLPLQKVNGTIDGEIIVGGTMQNPEGTIRGKMTGVVLDGYAVEPADIDVSLQNGIVKVKKLSLNVDGGLLKAEGTYALHGPVNMQMGCNNFNSKILLDILGKTDIPVETRLDGAVIIGGTGDHISADMSVQMNGGTINGISFTNIYGLANIRDGVIHINQALIAREPYKASAYGDIPLAALTGGTGTKETMNVVLKLDHAGLDALTFLTPVVTSGTGDLAGSIKVTGTLSQPLLHGTLSVQNGTITFRDVDNPLENIDASLVLDGTKATLTSTGGMGKKKHKGTYSLSGTVQWAGTKIVSYDGKAILDKLDIQCPYYKGPISGQLALDQGEKLPRLSGIVNVTDAMVNVPLSMEMSGSSSDMEMNLTVALGKNVRLYNPLLYDLIVTGTANFQGTVSHPLPSGRYEAQRGSVRYLDTKFSVTKATADFSQVDSFLPYLNVEAHGRVSQYNIMLNLMGPVEHMRLILKSQPPLSRQQIISLLTLRNAGKNSSSISSEDVSSLVGAGLRMTLNSLGITSELERFLSLDMLNITTGTLDSSNRITAENKNYYNIEMGKYLFNDFMITAAFGLNHGDNRVGMRYDLGTHFGLNAWHTSDGSTFGGAMYRYSF